MKVTAMVACPYCDDGVEVDVPITATLSATLGADGPTGITVTAKSGTGSVEHDCAKLVRPEATAPGEAP